jgi:hypothetical protein
MRWTPISGAWTPGRWLLLDAATLEAKRHLDAMIVDLDRMSANLERTLHALDRLAGAGQARD